MPAPAAPSGFSFDRSYISQDSVTINGIWTFTPAISSRTEIEWRNIDTEEYQAYQVLDYGVGRVTVSQNFNTGTPVTTIAFRARSVNSGGASAWVTVSRDFASAIPEAAGDPPVIRYVSTDDGHYVEHDLTGNDFDWRIDIKYRELGTINWLPHTNFAPADDGSVNTSQRVLFIYSPSVYDLIYLPDDKEIEIRARILSRGLYGLFESDWASIFVRTASRVHLTVVRGEQVNISKGTYWPGRIGWGYGDAGVDHWVASTSGGPSGIGVNAEDGMLTGAALQNGDFDIHVFNNVLASNNGLVAENEVVFKLTVTAASITSASTKTGVVGQALTHTVTANSVVSSFSASGLPSGLSINSTTGVISGTVGAAGTSSVSVTANIAAGGTATQTLTITIAALEITSASTKSCVVGSALSHQITSNGSVSTYAATGLPAGVSINASGLISGTPTVIGASTVTVTITAPNNSTATQTLTITVTRIMPAGIPVIDHAMTDGKAITAAAGEFFTFQPSATNEPESWSVIPTPEGLSINSATGALSGAFTNPGMYSVRFKAANVLGSSSPVVFYFLVEGIASGGDGIDICIEVSDKSVSFALPPVPQTLGSGETMVNAPALPKIESLFVKRGDTVPVNVRFLKLGKPVQPQLDSLKFGARVDLDSAYVLYADEYEQRDGASFRMLPDFSAQAVEDELMDLKEGVNTLELIGEIQWSDEATGLRCSSQTFPIVIARDVVNPD